MKIKLTVWSVLVVMAASAVAADLRIHNLPPAHRLHGPGPGVDGPGPGVLAPMLPASLPMSGLIAEPVAVQMLFNRPEGMQVRWDVSGVGLFDSEPLVLPGRQNFPEGGIYRLKLTNIPGREGVELYPTLEVGPASPRTAAYLAHNAIPIQFTEEDFDQVLSGNFVTKVIYLPDPEFQELALAGVETLVSTRLDPGVDPIVEADRRGSIMAVVRLGNKDIEMPGALAAGSVMHTSYAGAGPGGPGADGGAGVHGDAGVHGGANVHGGAGVYGGTMVPYGATPYDMSGGPVALGGSGIGPTGGLVPAHVAGLTTPAWGMPYSGTPIGLPGPPHIPLGAPAGLQKHVMKNHTHMHIPGPVEKFHIHVREMPGYSYPKPVSHMRIREQHIHPAYPFSQPRANQTQVVH